VDDHSSDETEEIVNIKIWNFWGRQW
jgi:hypothetical protein